MQVGEGNAGRGGEYRQERGMQVGEGNAGRGGECR